MQAALAHITPKFDPAPRPNNPKAEMKIDLLSLSNLHRFISGAYQRALEAQTAARNADHAASQARTELYLALSNIEDNLEKVENAAGIHTTKYITRDGYKCPACGKHEVADVEAPCSSCGTLMERG